MISGVFRVVYDALLQIIDRLELIYLPFSTHAVCHRHLVINAEKCVFSDRYHSFFSAICAVYVYNADCSGNHPRVLFSVVCNRGVNILLQLLHAVFVRDAAEYRFTDDFSVPVDNIGGRE